MNILKELKSNSIFYVNHRNMRILAFICLLVLSGLTGLYSQDTGDVQVKSGYV